MIKHEWWASSTFLWSLLKLVFAIRNNSPEKTPYNISPLLIAVDILSINTIKSVSYLHKFKMAAHDFHLVRLCTATC